MSDCRNSDGAMYAALSAPPPAELARVINPSADVERVAADEVESLAVGADAFADAQDGYGNAASAQILRECGTTLRALLSEREALASALRGVVDWLSQPVQGSGYDAPASKDAQALAIIRGDCGAARALAIRTLLRVGISAEPPK